ncbi:phage tail tape measure protein [Rahnella sp. GSA61A]|uniref:phage tail tape measure protein n=1 Tax=Rahnella sp. GSA61A TaxID=2862678 RepID=UPI001CBCC4DB|nr:phage tail tape measure protein [Rahnella sp. GSA61A]
MASKSLGTLTIDLIAKVGGFVGGLNDAERASEEWRKKVEGSVKAAGVAVAALGTIAASAALAIGSAGISFLKNTAEQVTEVDRVAKSLKISTQELLAWQFAADKAGLAGDNLNDVFKDISDKIGDAVINKSGEGVDALNALGLSAEKLAKASPDQQLLAIGEAVGKISTNAGKVTILESLGNDLSKMLPLFDNNNAKLKELIQQAKDYGVAPDQSSIDDLVKVNSIFQDMETQVSGLKMEIATGLAKVDISGLQDSFGKLKDVLTDPKILQGLTSLVSGVVELAGGLAKVAASAGDLIDNFKGSYDIGNSQNESVIQNRLKWLQEARKTSDSIETIVERTIGTMPESADIDKEISELTKRLDSIRKAGAALPTGKAIVAPISSQFVLPKGATNGKATPDAGAKKLESAFKSTELSYLRQIALIDTTGKKTTEVTEAQKLQFDLASGKLVGINAEQQKRLESLAAEVDQLGKLKKANEENAKAAAYAAGLTAENRNAQAANDIDVQGAGMGEMERDRLKELLSLQRDYLEKQADLQKQYQGGDISKDLYDQETSALESALQERLELQEKHYEDLDALRGDWVAGISDAWQNFADEATNYSQIAADNVSSLLGSATSSLSDGLESIVNGTESVGDALSTMISGFGQTVIQTLADMAAQWLVYQAVQLLVGKTTQASAIPAMVANAQATAFQAQLAAYASTAAIPIVGPALAPAAAAAAATYSQTLVAGVSASALSGMAHDGIDAVPETGTWLLQKGERVTTASTSAKLDQTLDRVGRQSTGGGSYNPSFEMTINGDPDARTMAMMEQAVKRGAQQGYDMVTSDIAAGTGRVSKGLGTGWQTKRRAR